MEKLNQKSLMISDAIKVFEKLFEKCRKHLVHICLERKVSNDGIYLLILCLSNYFRGIFMLTRPRIWNYLLLSHSLLTHLDMFDRLYRIGTSPSPYRWQSYYFSLYLGDS